MPSAATRLAVPLLLAAVAGCSSAPAPVPRHAPPSGELARFLTDPTIGATADDPSLAAVRSAHEKLLRTGDSAGVELDLAPLLAERPTFAPARVVAAQAALVAGRPAVALERVRPAVQQVGLPARLVEARALEMSGDAAAAAVVYARVAAESAAAREALDRLEVRAVEILAARVGESLTRGRFPEAESALDDLRAIRPAAPRTLELEADLARASGKRDSELAALRRLTADGRGEMERRLRRADLEMEIGDAPTGLAIVRSLAESAPGDAVLAEHLRRAQFRWRVLHAPETVRRVAGAPQISRADAAILLYWLLPQVRTGKVGEPRIASDALDHEAREEIVRIVNLGLLSVDETLHTFEPDRALRRSELLAALLRVLARDPEGPACVQGVGESARLSRNACELAVACGLLQSSTDCLASGPISGAEALELLRATTELSEPR